MRMMLSRFILSVDKMVHLKSRRVVILRYVVKYHTPRNSWVSRDSRNHADTLNFFFWCRGGLRKPVCQIVSLPLSPSHRLCLLVVESDSLLIPLCMLRGILLDETGQETLSLSFFSRLELERDSECHSDFESQDTFSFLSLLPVPIAWVMLMPCHLPRGKTRLHSSPYSRIPWTPFRTRRVGAAIFGYLPWSERGGTELTCELCLLSLQNFWRRRQVRELSWLKYERREKGEGDGLK